MMDIMAAASSAVAVALSEIGRGGAKKLGESAAETMWGWLWAKTAGRARRALEDLEEEPASPGYQAVLSEQLAKQLEQDPALLDQLREMLARHPAAGDHMEQNLGPGAKAAQIKGNRNKVTF